MNLLLVTHDFPYGNAETFLETEIEYDTKMFDKVYVISASQSEELTRKLPCNVIPVKASRKYHKYKCLFSALLSLFKVETIREVVNAKHQGFANKTIIKKLLVYNVIEKRLYDKVREEKLIGEDFIAYSYWLAEGAYFVGKNANLWSRTVSRVHSYEVWPQSYTPFISNTVQSLDKIYCISDNTRNLLYQKIDSVMIYKTVISRLGIAYPGRTSTDKCIEYERVFRIVTCSSIYQLKRLDLIIDSLACLPKMSRPIEWIHFGGGTDEVNIRNYAEEKLQDKVKWTITGWVSNSEVLFYYSSHKVDLFMNLSDNEGVPVSIMEAMSFGIPCIARDVGGNREIVNRDNGYLIDRNASAKQISEEIVRLLQNAIDPDVIMAFFKDNYSAKKNYSGFCEDLIR